MADEDHPIAADIGPASAGRLADGTEVQAAVLTGSEMSARILSYGAIIQDLRLAGHDAPLVLGFDDVSLYPEHSPYFGAIVGRCANRIAGGRFSIDGRSFQTDRNFRSRHTLHGGRLGTADRSWTFTEVTRTRAILRIALPDGESGFPGNLDIECIYELSEPSALSITLRATTDRPTPCNLAAHSYFNLDDGGASSIDGHRLSIAADCYLPVDGDLIPTGRVEPVENTPFDFRSPGRIADGGERYDHNWCLSAEPSALRAVAQLTGARSGLSMTLETTEAGVQFYDGSMIGAPPAGLDGIPYGPRSGLCLEPQFWPDAVNHRDFASPILRPGETYRQQTVYRFGRA